MTSLIDDTYDPWMSHALRQIEDQYDDRCIIGPKSTLKFGRTDNADANTETTVMTLPGATQRHETYLSSNLIDSISSADGGDSQEIQIEGHTLDNNGHFKAVAQTATLDGQNRVALTTAMARVARAVNRGSTDLTGPVYVFENDTLTGGVPNTETKVHMMIAAGRNQSQKAALTFSNNEHGLITSFSAGVLRTGAAVSVDVQLQVREFNGVFREQFPIPVRSDGQPFRPHELRPFLVIPKNSDVRVTCISSANDVSVIANFNTLYATIQ